MGRLQSGLLLFETPKGLVRVELCFKERVALLWTFRNFRRLSPRLLNSRENTLIHTLYRTHAGVVSHSYDPALVIGVVEEFVPSMEMGAPEMVAEKVVAQRIVAETSVAQRTTPREVAAQEIVAEKIGAEKVAASATRKKERKQKKTAERLRRQAAAGVAPDSRPGSSSPRVRWSTVMSRLATALGALSLCIVSVVAWHRIEAVPGSQAQSRPELEQVSAIALASAPVAEPVAVAAPAPAAELVADPDAPLKPTRISAGIPVAPITPAAAPALAAAPPAVATSAAAAPAAPALTVAMNSKRATRVHAVFRLERSHSRCKAAKSRRRGRHCVMCTLTIPIFKREELWL